MTVHKDIEQLPRIIHAVVTIGTFDGVHLGHRKIIDQLKEEATRIGGETVIITFHPHPRHVIHQQNKRTELINTIEERIDLLAALGVDHLVIVPFTLGFSELMPRDYVEQFLLAKFHPSVVIIGYDHKFGKDRLGDYKLLEEYSERGDFELREIHAHLINDSSVSSTQIRNALREGKIETANSLLGYPFFFRGNVVRGDQRGRTIGYPTANIGLDDPEKILPADGVYAVELDLTGRSERKYKGMMNIGVRPTVDGTKRTIEVNIFDFSEDIYGERVSVTVRKHLRQEQKFGGLDALKQQLAADREASLQYFTSLS